MNKNYYSIRVYNIFNTLFSCFERFLIKSMIAADD